MFGHPYNIWSTNFMIIDLLVNYPTYMNFFENTIKRCTLHMTLS